MIDTNNNKKAFDKKNDLQKWKHTKPCYSCKSLIVWYKSKQGSDWSLLAYLFYQNYRWLVVILKIIKLSWTEIYVGSIDNNNKLILITHHIFHTCPTCWLLLLCHLIFLVYLRYLSLRRCHSHISQKREKYKKNYHNISSL